MIAAHLKYAARTSPWGAILVTAVPAIVLSVVVAAYPTMGPGPAAWVVRGIGAIVFVPVTLSFDDPALPLLAATPRSPAVPRMLRALVAVAVGFAVFVVALMLSDAAFRTLPDPSATLTGLAFEAPALVGLAFASVGLAFFATRATTPGAVASSIYVAILAVGLVSNAAVGWWPPVEQVAPGIDIPDALAFTAAVVVAAKSAGNRSGRG